MQNNINRLENLISDLHLIDCNAATFSIMHINEVQADIEHFISREFIDKNLRINFNFDWGEVHKEAKSVLIVAIPSLAVNVSFNIKGNILKTLVPPNYVYEKGEKKIKNILNKNLPSGSYVNIKNMLPLKLLAVKTGIGKYGKNNLCYINGMGTHLRLFGFYLNIEAKVDSWNELCMLERCNVCTNCIKICPTKCITEDRFMIRAEKCLTHFNGSEKNLPPWIKKEWHNALVGCIKCQEICPENESFIGKTQFNLHFNKTETTKILENESIINLEDKTIKKLQSLDFLNDIFLVGRNLKLLI